MVDKSCLGAEGTPFEMAVEAGKIHEFARAIGAAHDDHKGHEPVIPPTFLTTQFFWEERVDGANPWDLVKMSQERGMHAEQEYVFHGPPPRAGDRLFCTSRIDSVTEKEGRRGGTLVFVKMITEFRDENGKLVAEARMTGVEAGQVPT
jgi:hypothetical protein